MGPQGNTTVDFSDGSYKLIMGSANVRGGTAKTLTTMVYRDGKCLAGHFTAVQGGKSGLGGLKENANLCLGDKNDNVEVLTKTRDLSCGKNKLTLSPSYTMVTNSRSMAAAGTI